MSALIFVLQMINFPIAAGTSGHLLGGALAVIVLGPHLGIICISIVVVIQSLLFADGGLSAVGINVFNMAIVTSLVGWLVITSWKKLFGEANISIISGSIVAGLLSVIFSSIAFVFEYALGGTVAVPLSSVLLAMLSTHLLIGLGEGIITALIVSLEGPSIAAAVLIIAKYQYQIAFVADQEINLLACLTEIMVECEFK